MPAENKPDLIYTIAFDPPGCGGTRQTAKMLASSLLRTGFAGHIIVFRSTDEPLFRVERLGLEEQHITLPSMAPEDLARYAMDWKWRAREHIRANRYGRILFLDADCLALRNIDHLLEGEDWDVRMQREAGRSAAEPVYHAWLTEQEMAEEGAWGINSGTWAVRGEHYSALMEEWERIAGTAPLRDTPWTEQGAWNRLLRDTGLRVEEFGAGEVQFPMHIDMDWRKHREAALLHYVGTTNGNKLEAMFGMWMQRFFYDPGTLMVNLLEM
jgi:hypothetical protein